MFYLRPGSILDLSIIASDNYISNAADSLGIPNSTLAAYISGARSIKPSAAWDIGIRWGRYIYQFLTDILLDKEKKETNTPPGLDIDWWEEIIEVRDCAQIFEEHFQTEYNLRQIVEPISWQKSFGCCAAQVLARFEANQLALSKLNNFSKDDAISLLNILINGPFTEENLPNLQNLALRYVLWRVKTREHYKLEQFLPTSRCIEIRDARPMPLLQQDIMDDLLFIPDHLLYDGTSFPDTHPDTPRLKKAATLDVLMLCRSVEVRADQSKNTCHCSCTSYSNDFIYFKANPVAAAESKY
ncbi:hypothetical protein [Desulfoscipio gibsoniae]